MIKNLESVLLYSNDSKKLSDFYKNKIGLKLTMEAEMGEDGESVYGFEFKNGVSLVIMNHSKVKGKNDLPERCFLNYEVDDIDKEIERLRKEGVIMVQEKYHIESYGYVATFEDVDGNYFQLVQIMGTKN